MILPASTESATELPVRLRADESAALLEIAQAAGSTLDLHEVLERVVERTAMLAGADRCSLWLLDTPHKLLLPAAIYGIDPSFAARWKRRVLALDDERLSQEAIATAQPVVVVDASTDPRTDKNAVDFFGDKSFLVVPVANKGRVIGTLFLNHISVPYQYSSHEIAVIQAIASQSAVAIENAQLYEESQRRRLELLASFRRIGDALAAGHDLDGTLRLVVEIATEMLQATVGVLALTALDGAESTVHWVPPNAPRLFDSALQSTKYLAKEVTDRGQPLYLADLQQTLDPNHAVGAATHLRTYVGVPLQVRGESIGTLEMYHALPRHFSPDEVDLLASFGAQAAIAIDNARLFHRLQHKVEELSAAAARNAELYANLQLEKRRLDVIFRNSSDAIFMADSGGSVVAFNPAAEQLTEWSVEEAAGKPFHEIFPSAESENPSLSEVTRRVLVDGTGTSGVVEAVIKTRLGRDRHVAASYAYVPASQGEGPFALAVVRDVSQQKEVDRLKSDFISMVSHELRTPLAVIKGYAATLLNPTLNLDTGRQTRFLRGISDASDRLTRLIDNVLSVSRLESGRFKLNPQMVELGEIIRRVIVAMRPSSAGHEIRFDSGPATVTICVDRDQFEQVLVNLLGNAIKYSPDGGAVDVGLERLQRITVGVGHSATSNVHSAWALVSVHDRGIGIPPSQHRLIFDKFYRGNASAVRKVAGTGLGLYICKSIVEAHGGHIWVESEPGVGTTFFVALPQEL
jgi:PAS domain S-box-containing protein